MRCVSASETDLLESAPEGSGNGAPFRLGGWLVEPRLLRVSREERAEKLEPRAMQTLEVMAARAGDPVTRDELMTAVWGHSHLTDEALTRIVSRLRRCLEGFDDVRIETIPKVGYRLVVSGPHPGAGAGGRPGAGRAVLWTSAVLLAVLAAGAVFAFLPRGDDLLVTQASDSRVTPLTSLPGREVDPALSPDGSRVAFSWSGDGDWNLWLQAVGSESRLQLTDGPGRDFSPTWAPDGSRIAFIRYGDDRCEVRSVAPVGGGERRLASCNPDADPSLDWTPDGRHLVFSAPRAEGPPGLDLLELETGERRVLTTPGAGELVDAQPAVSPDGDWLAFTRWHAFGVGNVFLVPVAGGDPRQVTFDNLKIHGVSWEPDGEHLVFGSNRGGNFALWRVSIAGDAPRRVPINGRTMDDPHVSRDGRRLVWEEWSANSDIVAMAPGEDAPRSLAASTRYDWAPAVSPDGRRLAFASDRSGSAEIWVQSLRGGNAMRLTGFAGPYTGNPAWSPDGTMIAFDTPVDGQFDIWVVPAEGGAPERITSVASQERYPAWSPDGQGLYFGSNRTGEWQIWRRDLQTGEEAQVTAVGGEVAQVSGQWLYFASAGLTGGELYRQSLGGSPAERVLDSLQPHHVCDWRATDNAVWFMYRESANSENLLKRADLESGEVETMGAYPGFSYKSGLDVMPDGSVLYARAVESESDLMIAELP